MEDEIETYNNGNGWRIAIPLGGQRHVLEIEDAQALANKILYALNSILVKEFKEFADKRKW